MHNVCDRQEEGLDVEKAFDWLRKKGQVSPVLYIYISYIIYYIYNICVMLWGHDCVVCRRTHAPTHMDM